jgi:hypothetical protein
MGEVLLAEGDCSFTANLMQAQLLTNKRQADYTDVLAVHLRNRLFIYGRDPSSSEAIIYRQGQFEIRLTKFPITPSSRSQVITFPEADFRVVIFRP